jgi:cysteine desulfurase
LIIASALAIDSWVADEKTQSQKILDANLRIRGFINERIPDCDFGSPEIGALPHQLSFSFLYVDAERLVSELADMNIAIDSGSACNSANMEPSHVLAAQGVLTHGNVRITLHHDVLPEQVDLLLLALQSTVEKLRA